MCHVTHVDLYIYVHDALSGIIKSAINILTDKTIV